MRVAWPGVALFLTASIVACPFTRSHAADGGFVEIFNGRDLSGWVADGKDTFEKDGRQDPIWLVERGMLVCQGHGFTFLRYDQVLDDFTVRLEFRVTPKSNTGLGIRAARFTGPKSTRPSTTGYELQLLDDHGRRPSRYSSGSLYRYLAPKTNAIKPAGEWNSVEIECRGPRIKVTLNEQLIQDIDQSRIDVIAKKPLSGYFSLQNHNSPVMFRNIRLKKL